MEENPRMAGMPTTEAPRPPPSGYWFCAKRYGYGWGLPRTWQGWLVTISFLASLYLIVRVYNPRQQPMQYSLAMLASFAVFLLICRWKSEPARWRWGGDTKISALDDLEN